MTESWRIKKYYGPRVLIETERILNPEFSDTIICITGAQVEMLRNLTQYLHRRSTFSQDNQKDYYLAPNNDDWNTISYVVADLEETLMGCDIESLIAVLEIMTECVCALSSRATSDVPLPVNDNGSTLAPDLATETAISNTGVPVTDILKCELANVLWGFTFQFITETLLPFANGVADATTAAIAATTLFAIISGGLGLSLALVAALFYAIVQYLLDSATSNLINWMVSNAQESVCELYNGLYNGGYELAASNMTTFIDDSGLPLGDRMMLKLTLTSTWFFRAMQYQIDELAIDPADYDDYSCDACLPPDYLWPGDNCPDGLLTGNRCREGFPAMDIGTSAWTIEPYVDYITDATGYACNWEASGRVGLGGTINMLMKRQSDGATIETHQFVVSSSSERQQFSHTFSAYAIDSVYFWFAAVGAGVASLYWLSCDVELP